MRKTGLMLAAAAALSIAAPANAVIVNNFNISGTGTGTMSLDLTGGVYSLSAFNYLLHGTTYNTSNSGVFLLSATSLLVGANATGGPDIVASNNDDFWFFIDPTLGSQTASMMQYGFVGNTQGLINGTAVLTVAAAGGVPEPATWAMMLLGFAGIGLATRRRKV